jgi:hypothetical protein
MMDEFYGGERVDPGNSGFPGEMNSQENLRGWLAPTDQSKSGKVRKRLP